jgi:glycerate kinase
MGPTVISRTVLIATERFGASLDAERAGAAIGRGVRAADPTLAVDVCPIEGAGRGDAREPRELLEAVDFDVRMRAARAVVVGTERLDERTLLTDRGVSAVFEIATRARQAGVPAYAVATENTLSLFDARVLDLQVIVEAGTARALRRAGEQLAGVV